ncbi:hypothetical protein M2322_003562 [Rhodoblastus acidophilus]|nr:hypothetical protein [Rhodoblastus acidophilus]
MRRVLERAGFLANPAPGAARFWLHAEQA